MLSRQGLLAGLNSTSLCLRGAGIKSFCHSRLHWNFHTGFSYTGFYSKITSNQTRDRQQREGGTHGPRACPQHCSVSPPDHGLLIPPIVFTKEIFRAALDISTLQSGILKKLLTCPQVPSLHMNISKVCWHSSPGAGISH